MQHLVRLALVAALAACGGSSSTSTGSPDASSSGGGGSIACTYPKDFMGPGTHCAEYQNTTSAQHASITNSCATAGGTTSTSCSATDLLGCCVQTSTSSGVCYYADTGKTAADEMASCPFVWQPTP